MNKTNTSTSNLTSKIRSSLVLKLNARMFFRLIASFLALNILVLLMGFFVIFRNVENGIDTIVAMIEHTDNAQLTYNKVGKYIISDKVERVKYINLPSFIEKQLSKQNDWKRAINQSDVNPDARILEKIESIRYIVATNVNGKPYQIIYLLGNDIKTYLALIMILLIIELIIIIDEISKGAREIRRILRPIYELTETAKNLNQEVATLGMNTGQNKIKDLAGVISSIDANKLDKRISIDSSQEELKELAAAINDMLNRINDSYQSQVRFVSDASHELRTPISVIQGYVNLLDRWGKRDEKTMQESIDAIKSETQHMKELVEKLLFLARGDNETIQLYREDIDICQIVEEIVREAEMIDPNHSFNMELSGPAYISADKQLIKQAIRVLIDNSIKFTANGGSISLKVKFDDDKVYISVQDEGIGIAPEDIPRIFDRFYRSDESRARKSGGSGLGLSIAKWIVEKHGGYFEVLSRVNIGTRISIVLPKIKIEKSDLEDEI